MALSPEEYANTIKKAKEYASGFVQERTGIRIPISLCSSSFVKGMAVALGAKFLKKRKKEYSGVYIFRAIEHLGITLPDGVRVNLKNFKKDAKKVRWNNKKTQKKASEKILPDGLRERCNKKPQRIGKETKEEKEDRLKNFYNSEEWIKSRARYAAIKNAKGVCQCCGAGRKDGARLVVDHIKPLRHYWELRLDPDNTQVLCDQCNMGKGSWDETDWRDKKS